MARALEAQAAMQEAQRRNEELRRVSAETRRRREQLWNDRAQIRAQLALRRSLINTPDRRAAGAILDAAVSVAGMSLHELWLEYFALGGDATSTQIQEMLAGRVLLTRTDHDRLAVVLNERLSREGWGRPLAYWDGSR